MAFFCSCFEPAALTRDEILNCIVSIRMQIKQLERHSTKALKDERALKKKMAGQMKAGATDMVRLTAENATRKRNEAMQYSRLASRLDAVRGKVELAQNNFTLFRTMIGVVRTMDASLASMNPMRVANVMDHFEKQFEDLDVVTTQMNSSVESSTALMAPQADVDKLIEITAQEYALDLKVVMPDYVKTTPTAVSTSQQTKVEPKLEAK